MAPEERRLALLSALLLPLRAAEISKAGKPPTPLTSYVVLDAIKWKRKDAEAVAALHAAAPELLRISQTLQARVSNHDSPCDLPSTLTARHTPSTSGG